MGNEKRYYWLKFREDFFESKRIKRLRRMAGGDTYLIIYLKMQLKALKTGGVLQYTGIEDCAADEIALDIDEEPDNVKIVLTYLLANGLCECSDNINYLLPYVLKNTGSETAGTQRVRDYRERQKALHCNADVTQVKRLCNAEKDIDKEIELERDIDNTLEDDEDDSSLMRASEDDEWERDLREVELKIRQSFGGCVGRDPLPSELESISRFATNYRSGPLIGEAICRAATRGVKNIAPYVGRIMEEWHNANVTNMQELVQFDRQYER